MVVVSVLDRFLISLQLTTFHFFNVEGSSVEECGASPLEASIESELAILCLAGWYDEAELWTVPEFGERERGREDLDRIE